MGNNSSIGARIEKRSNRVPRNDLKDLLGLWFNHISQLKDQGPGKIPFHNETLEGAKPCRFPRNINALNISQLPGINQGYLIVKYAGPNSAGRISSLYHEHHPKCTNTLSQLDLVHRGR